MNSVCRSNRCGHWQWSLRALLLSTTFACVALATVRFVKHELRRRLIQREVDIAISTALDQSHENPEIAKLNLRMLSEQIDRARNLLSADHARHQEVISNALADIERRQPAFEIRQRRMQEDTSCAVPIIRRPNGD
jgi:hypothetical protein